ncbi:MAG: hypothetical protein M3N46_09525 [Actinomycetota bacterium]|nr:hypothetical protein [Actinomycetota bacterium]
MKRVHVLYGGNEFLIGDRDADEVEREIEAALASGRPGWLTVSYGEGRPTRCRLLLTPGVSVAVLQLPTDA